MAAAIHTMAQQDFQRWELPNVGTQPTASKAANTSPQPTVHELAALERQAREEGYAAGHAEGKAAAQQQLRQRMAQLDALYESAARPLQALDEQTEQELARLATIVASRVIVRELQLAPGLIAKVVRQAASALPAATRELRVHVHPDDLALLQELGAAESHWQLLADPALARGDCQLESARSRLDARVETRLAAIIDAVLGDDAGHAGPDA
ncbi:flagellar assembly protein FliH [Rhodanobacter glycinis]|uniref:Flagellar assembly protein FliH n=1 Tax=Rhodanobacter glycinis TaxID=582702 RepID=A0A502F9Z7_9GAMM|nr:FliH/SctL family protein [Rhodanobacter glycinis]TPG07385.1 flagellar assembly protein FliH [Rhodanobacter glycinis]TPG46228.1 flagellar assembly protein FliH [Rhodanobacter glycinis]